MRPKYREWKPYTGPGALTFPRAFTSEKVNRVSYEHDYSKEYAQTGAYTGYNLADYRWQRATAGLREPAALLGNLAWKVKSLFGGQETTENMSGRSRFGGHKAVPAFGGLRYRQNWKKPAYARRRLRGASGTNLFHALHCVERKFFDRELDAVTSSATGVITSLISGAAASGIGISRGTGPKNRIGSRIFISDFHLRLQLSMKVSTVSGASCVHRIILFQDLQSNGTTPTMAQVLDVSGASDYIAWRNLENTKRFKVLWEKIVVMEPQSGAGNGTANDFAAHKRILTYNHKFKKPIRVLYDTDNTDGEADGIITNNVWLMVINECSTLDELSMKSRTRYTD